MLYYVSSTVNPILYNVMSYRYRRAFRDTLLRCTSCRQPTSSLRTVNDAALMSSFTFLSTAASLRNDRMRSRLYTSTSAMTKITSIDRPSNDETATRGGTAETEQLAVGGHGRGRQPATSESDDSWTVRRSEEVANTPRVIDNVVVHAILER